MKRLLFIAGILSATPATAEVVQNAFALCSLVDNTGLASAPCEVSGWNQSVTAVIDMSSGEARTLCSQIAGLMSQKGLGFDPWWTLQIRSPYSGGNSIAFCSLKQ